MIRVDGSKCGIFRYLEIFDSAVVVGELDECCTWGFFLPPSHVRGQSLGASGWVKPSYYICSVRVRLLVREIGLDITLGNSLFVLCWVLAPE